MVGITGALIGAAASVGGAAIANSGAKSAARSSENAANTAAQVQREQFQGAQNALMPFQQAGLPATQQINALLGLGGTAGTPATPGAADYSAYVRANPDLMADFQKVAGRFGGDMGAYGQYHWNTYGNGEPGRELPMTGGTPGTAGTSSADAARAAFEQFRNSTGYDWRVKQGMNALNSGYAGAGTLKSGAAIKGAVDYGQGMASQEFGNYLGALGNQQALGLSAGSALAGVGQNYANSLGNIYMQNGANQANSALVRSANTGQAVNSLAGIAGNVFGGTNFGGGGGVNMNALNAGTAAYSPALASPYAGQTNDWRTW